MPAQHASLDAPRQAPSWGRRLVGKAAVRGPGAAEYVNSTLTEWTTYGAPRRAGVGRPRRRAGPRFSHRLAGERLGEAGDPARLPLRPEHRCVCRSRPVALLRQGHAAAEAARPSSAGPLSARSAPGPAALPSYRRSGGCLPSATTTCSRPLPARLTFSARRLAREGLTSPATTIPAWRPRAIAFPPGAAQASYTMAPADRPTNLHRSAWAGSCTMKSPSLKP